ncbi:hypothetical protein ACFL6L_04810 [candidate division KSB1 bacterium]
MNDPMHGFLNELVVFNGLTLDPGTIVQIEPEQAEFFNTLSPEESIVVDVNMTSIKIKAIVKKAQIELASLN